jgi:putative restriction endonuclease
LLRRDIHSLFDAGYVTVTPDFQFKVSKRIREQFANGKHYYALDGQSIGLPDNPVHAPDRDALAWHNTERFLA